MLALKKQRKISNNLKKRFLYDDDIYSVDILVSIFESEEYIKNLHPIYTTVGSLRDRVKMFIRGRKGNDLAANNIAKLIHNDINRYELFMSLEGYRAGLASRQNANNVEEFLLTQMEIQELYCTDFHCEEIESDLILEYREKIVDHVIQKLSSEKSFNQLTRTYIRRILKPKIYNLNTSLDMQLIIDDDLGGIPSIKYEASLFTMKELTQLYIKINRMLVENVLNIYAQAYWAGIIEKVRNRYR